MINRDEWVEKLNSIFEGTKYQAIINPTPGEKSVNVVERNTVSPRYIAIWPKRDNANIRINRTVQDKVDSSIFRNKEVIVEGNWYDYRNIDDDFIFHICSDFVRNKNVDDVKFTVIQSVWIAAALMSAEVFMNNTSPSIEDYYFKQSEIVKKAQLYADGIVHSPRVSSWTCADAEKHTYNYLRGDNRSDGSLRRLSMPEELGGEKTIPTDLDDNDERLLFEIGSRKTSLKELFQFVRSQYKLKIKPTDIDYLCVLEYLDRYRSILNSNQNSYDSGEREEIGNIDVRIKEQSAVTEINKMAELCSKRFKLNECKPIRLLGSSDSKIEKYFCVKMKYEQFAANPISISIFAEFSPETDRTRYRFSLDIEEDKADSKEMVKYHSYLNLPVETESFLVYVADNDNFGTMKVLHESKDLIRQKVTDVTYEKVQLCRILEWVEGLTNDRCEKVMMEAIEALVPYYEYVLGTVNEVEEAGEMESVNTNKSKFQKMDFDKNLLLFGPPGTGKTYNSAIYAVAICDNKSVEELTDYDTVMKRYNELKKEHRIVFTTFHQSYGYEEFIEGIKPVVSSDNPDSNGSVSYKIESGIFKEFCENAKKTRVKANKFDIPDDSTIWKVTITSEVKSDCFNNNRVRIGWEMDSDGADAFVNDMKTGDIIITTDGSRSFINGICVITKDEAYSLDYADNTTTRDVMWLANDILEDIRSINNDKILHRMTVARVPAMRIGDIVSLAKAHNNELTDTEIEENDNSYVFVIDEINRGNISKIFGELITLIEDSKREGMPEAASAMLPYSGELFSVPKNVYIIGTMNTADRSIALMDTALRRRFSFIEMMPATNVLRAVGADKVEGLDVAEMLDVMNERICFLYDREHTIGHAFFTGLKDDPSVERLGCIFEKSVIPLLQEYFYEDYQKIQMVLGDNGKENPDLQFIIDERIVAKSIFKGNIEDVIDLPEKKYSINKNALSNIQSYIEIM